MHLLLVESDHVTREQAREAFDSRGLTVVAVADAAAARDLVRYGRFEVVILDAASARPTPGLLEELRGAGSRAHVIILGGAATEHERVVLLDRGADDCLASPFHLPELIARVNAVRRRMDGHGELVLEFGPLAINMSGRSVTVSGSSVPLTVKEFDLLAFLATRAGRSFSRDELLRGVWQSASDWQQASTVTEHIRRVRSKIERDPARPQFLMTVRGVGYRFESPSESEGPAGDDIRSGIENDEFEVHYLPIIALADESIVAVEALIRWHRPDQGLLTPDAFMAVAEREGLMVELGQLVLDKACRQVAAWRAKGIDVELTVNVSAAEVADASLTQRVPKILRASGLDPHALWLEVKEASLVDDIDRATAVLKELSSLGVRIAVDDFGTGWASLTYLRTFSIHALKIDRSFVDGLDQNPSAVAIARSVISLGAELGLEVIAEGIETRPQLRLLQSLGCAFGQGYLFGRPALAAKVPVERARRLSKRRAKAG